MKRDILKDGLKTGTITTRLNRGKDTKSWLSMQPNPLGFHSRYYIGNVFSEENENNRLNGRGIHIYNDGRILIGYFDEDDELSTGNYIKISRYGDFFVGERYEKDGD